MLRSATTEAASALAMSRVGAHETLLLREKKAADASTPRDLHLASGGHRLRILADRGLTHRILSLRGLTDRILADRSLTNRRCRRRWLLTRQVGGGGCAQHGQGCSRYG